MTESEYRNAVFHLEAASNMLRRAIRGGSTLVDIDDLTAKLEAAKQSLATLLENATGDERRAATLAMSTTNDYPERS